MALNKILLFICLSVISYSLKAQDTIPLRPFVKLDNGKIITGTDVLYAKRAFKPDLFVLDEDTFFAKNVMFYGDGFHNTLYGRLANHGYFPCYYKARNTYFFKITTYVNSHPSARIGSSAYDVELTKAYYSEGLGKIKVMSVKNMYRTIKDDDPVARNLIRRAYVYSKIGKISWIVFGVSALSLAATTNFISFPGAYYVTFISAGGVFAVIPALIFPSVADRKLHKAVYQYYYAGSR